jgi:TP901 family phage tail tape measure protein
VADDSRNPADAANLRRLESELQDVAAQLRNELAQARREREQAGARARRQSETQAGAEARTRRSIPEASRRPIEPDAARAVARDSEVIAEAQTRAAKAGERLEQSLRNQRRALPPARSIQLGEGTRLPDFYNQYGGVIPPGGGAPPPPPRPPAPPGPPDEPGPRRSLRDTIDGYRRQADAARGAAGAEGAYRNSLRETIAMGGQYDDSLRRHGALTTEFFSALARGEVTMAEFRWQMTATMLKFAGWTAASVAVFGALDAIRNLGKGAIDASAGVNQLQRYVNDVDTDKAQGQFVDLAQQFNLPIGDVSDAMAKMGQVFHTQNAAFEASKAALYGVKTGQLDVADSTRYLLAIVRGFQLPADQLGAVYDRINQAQNQFGVGIRDNAAGVGKAAGNWKAAGGDVSYLTDLITAGSAKTGRSGEEMGTAFQRSAEIIRRTTAKNAKELRAFGIDAAAPVDEVYKQAFALVQSGKVHGARITALATALSTPQLAGRISPILQDPSFFQKVVRTLDRSSGSAAKELHTQLQSAHEEIKGIGIGLQTVGAEFVRAGGAAPLGAMLHGLNLALTGATDLLGVFNELPKPLREVAVVGLEIAAVMRVLNRFGIGGRLSDLRRGPGSVEARRNASREVDFFQGKASFEQARLQDAKYEQTVAARLGDAEAREAAGAAVIHAEERLAIAEAELRTSIEARTAMNRRATVVDGLGGAGAGGARGARSVAAMDAELAAAYRTRNVRPGPSQGFPRGVVGGAIDKGLWAAYRGSAKFGEYAEKAAGKMGQLAALEVGAFLGPFDAVIAAFLILPPVIHGIKDALDKAKQAVDDAQKPPQTHKEAVARAKPQSQAFISPDPLDNLGYLGLWYRDRLAKYGFGTSNRNRTLDRQTAQTTLDYQAVQRSRRAMGQDVAIKNLPTSEIRRDAAHAVEMFKKGQINRNEAIRLVNGSIKDIRDSTGTAKQRTLARVDLQALRDSLGPGGGDRRSLREILDALSLKDFQTRMQQDADAVSTYGFRTKRLTDIATGYRSALAKAKKAPTSDNINRLKAAQAAIDTVVQTTNQRLTDALAVGSTLGERERAYEQALRRLQRLPKGRQRTAALHDLASKRFDDELGSFDARTQLGESRIVDPGQRAQYTLERMNERVARLRVAVRRGTKREEDLWAAEAQREQALQAVAEAQMADYQSSQGLAAARYALSVAGNQGPILQHNIADAQAFVAWLSHHRHTGQQMNDALKAVADAQLAGVQYTREQAQAMLQAEEAYATAGIDPGNSLAVARARERFARLRRRRTPGQTAAERKQQDADVRQTEADTMRARQQDRFDTIEFEASIGKISREQEISQLQTLLRTVKNNRALRRSIRQQIYQLRHQADSDSGVDLNVGNIKLPTVYEIRRAIKGGAGPTQHQVTVQNNNRINLDVNSAADVDEVFSRIDEITGSSLAAAGRSAGVR